MSVEGVHWMKGDWSSVSSATEESLGRVTQVIIYPIPVTPLPYIIDTIKALQHCQSCVVQFYMFHFQHSISSPRLYLGISSVQLLSHVRVFVVPWIAALQASLSITNSWSSLRLTSIKSVMPSSHLSLCRPFLLLPPPNASQHQSLSQWVNFSHEVAKVLEFQL